VGVAVPTEPRHEPSPAGLPARWWVIDVGVIVMAMAAVRVIVAVVACHARRALLR
jgi:hypothetical protein